MNYLQPWKLVTLALGIAALILGRFYYSADDWTISLSIVMGVAAYYCAPISYHQLRQGTFMGGLIAAVLGWLVVDFSYTTWNVAMGDPIYRGGQWIASTLLYIACGILWGRNETFAQMLRGLRLVRS